MSKNENNVKTFNLMALAMSWGIMMAMLVCWLSIWSRYTGIGYGFWNLYSGFLPSPYSISMTEPTLLKHAVGVVIDTFYAFIDGIILSSIWGFLYNFFAARRGKI